jgi:hypothetical protein
MNTNEIQPLSLFLHDERNNYGNQPVALEKINLIGQFCSDIRIQDRFTDFADATGEQKKQKLWLLNSDAGCLELEVSVRDAAKKKTDSFKVAIVTVGDVINGQFVLRTMEVRITHEYTQKMPPPPHALVVCPSWMLGKPLDIVRQYTPEEQKTKAGEIYTHLDADLKALEDSWRHLTIPDPT